MNGSFIFAAANLTADPELRFTPTGKAVTNVRAAVNHRVKTGDQWTDAEPTFYEVTLWEAAAEHAAESLRRGDRIIFAGLVHTEAFEVDGVKRTKQVVQDAEVGASCRFSAVSIERKA